MIKHKKAIFAILLLIVASILSPIVVLFNYSFTHADTRKVEDYMFDAPNSDDILVVEEWSDFRNSGDVFFIQRGEKKIYLGEVTTNEYLPFKSNQYDLLWGDNEITIWYKYGLLQDWKKEVFVIPRDRGPVLLSPHE